MGFIRSLIQRFAATAILLLGGSCLLSSCAPAKIPLLRVTRLELPPQEGRGPGSIVIDGPELRRVLATAVCREGTVLWKGGIPATIVLDDGRRVHIDGLSFYGHFIRVNRSQWCEIGDAEWEFLLSRARPGL